MLSNQTLSQHRSLIFIIHHLMKIAYISTYLPRECGLATFNNNLLKAINSNLSGDDILEKSMVFAMHQSEDKTDLTYPKEVKYILREQSQEDYNEAAALINASDVDAVILQHEFGIYGGESGIYVLPFINQLEKPVITILHTILNNPTYLQKSVIKELAKRSAKIVVMGEIAVRFLTDIYKISKDKIAHIEHGVPDLEAPEVNPIRNLPELKDQNILLTFGLISRNKGLETTIKALPKIVAQHPNTKYVILGNTHPGIIKHSGEEYRDYLKALAEELGVANNVVFMNKFVEEEHLIDYLTACDVYITPYFNEDQITSGTLSYAVGAGAAVVSTPYWHAKELLSNNRGCLFNFKDHEALGNIVNELLNEPKKLNKLKTSAYQYGLNLRWPKIGRSFLKLAEKAAKHPDYSEKILREIVDPSLMPELDLSYVVKLTDDTGMFQHAKYGIPNRKEGYCLDDNSRALIMALMAYQENKSPEALKMMPIFLSYIHDMQLEDGDFRNFYSYSRQFLDDRGTDDSFGRTVWSLGYLINHAPNRSYLEFGYELFFKSVQHFDKLEHLRGVCNTLIGVCYFLKKHPQDERLLAELKKLTQKLLDAYLTTKDEEWHWFENHMTYDNAIFPLALFHSFEITGDDYTKEIAFEALAYLEKITFNLKVINPVGNNGWFFKGKGPMPLYDQQAIEIMAMTLLYQQIYAVSGDSDYMKKMFTSYMWFLGENSLRIPLYDEETKGCADGLQANGVNRNQGAESTLAYLISHLGVMQALKQEQVLTQNTKRTVAFINK